MRSIEANYEKFQTRNVYLGVFPCLVKAVRNKKFSRKALLKSFNDLMPESEYSQDEKKELVDYLEYMANLSEEGEIRSKNAPYSD
jgi:hypothetical protein